MLTFSRLGPLGPHVLVLLALFGWSPSAHAFDAATKRGVDFRTDLSFAPTLFEARYDGPSESFEGSPIEDVHFSAVDLAMTGRWGFGVGFRDGRRNRWGIDGSLACGPTVGNSDGLPYVELTLVGLWSLGPSYSRVLGRSFELDLSLRGSGFAFTGGRADVAAANNVVEFSHHVGLLGRVGGLYRLTPTSRFGLVSAIEGGHYFAGHQTATVGIWSVGLQFN